MVDTLGVYKASFFEAIALTLYEFLNAGSWSRQPHSCTVHALRKIGPGFRGAEHLTDLIVVVFGLTTTPRVVGEHTMSRNDGAGDFLASSVFLLWFSMALLLWLTRTVGRKKDEVPLQSRSFPWVLINDAFPDPARKHYIKLSIALIIYNVFVFIVTLISLQTLIAQTYGGQNRVFGSLLAIRTSYMAIACVEDWTQMNAEHGIPRRLPRQFMALRATFVMVATSIFTGVLVAASPSWF